MKKMLWSTGALVMVGLANGSNGGPHPRQVETLDVSQMLVDIRVLANDSMEGRATGSRGNAMARQYITRAFADMGLRPIYESFSESFDFVSSDSNAMVGSNIVGVIDGTRATRPYLVVSAHFDHLGVRSGRIFNGADDNASGVAMMLAVARYFVAKPPMHPIVFVAFDAEEQGLRGARAFVADPPVDLASIGMVVNLDMVSHSDSVLFVSGVHHYPYLRPIVERVAVPSGIVLRLGHDQPAARPGDDWTGASDHAPFHAAGVPFLYFGVEDHPDYHAPTDDVERINEGFFTGAAHLVLGAVLVLDRNLSGIASRTRPQ